VADAVNGWCRWTQGMRNVLKTETQHVKNWTRWRVQCWHWKTPSWTVTSRSTTSATRFNCRLCMEWNKQDIVYWVWYLPVNHSGMTCVNKEWHSFTCHLYVHPHVEWAIRDAIMSITGLWYSAHLPTYCLSVCLSVFIPLHCIVSLVSSQTHTHRWCMLLIQIWMWTWSIQNYWTDWWYLSGVLMYQMETVNNELSVVRQRATEAEQKLTDADEDVRQKHQHV